MKEYTIIEYPDILKMTKFPDELWIGDSLGGFDINNTNYILDHIHKQLDRTITIHHDQIFSDCIKQNYPRINFRFRLHTAMWDSLSSYRVHPKLDYKNFICSFNGSEHVGRQLLVSILHRFNFFNPEYSSKNFTFTLDDIEGNILLLAEDQERVLTKFFISQTSNNFFQTEYSFGHNRFDHANNIYSLESKITKSFVHLVSESLSTYYNPIITEKFLYSVVTRGLFVAYAQPGWHVYLEKYYGFKKYTKLFDYSFDSIINPVERLVALVSMLTKFSILAPNEWQDLYQVEKDAIEYNHNHYFSGKYLEHLHQYEN